MTKWLLLPLLLAGCGRSIEAPANQATLDKIAASCGLPRGEFVLERDGHVHVDMAKAPTESADAFSCAARKIAATPLRMKLAYVGEHASDDRETEWWNGSQTTPNLPLGATPRGGAVR